MAAKKEGKNNGPPNSASVADIGEKKRDG